MPTGIAEAERIQWAGRDVTLWCSKLGDYMLTAPQRLVLLQCPNCYAIFVFLLHSGQTPLVMSLGYMMWFPTQRQHQQRGLALELGPFISFAADQGCSLAGSWMMSHMWHIWFIHISKRRCICLWERTLMLNLSNGDLHQPDLSPAHFNKSIIGKKASVFGEERKKRVTSEDTRLLIPYGSFFLFCFVSFPPFFCWPCLQSLTISISQPI